MPDSDCITPSKRCSKCGTEYPATTEYFHRNSYGKYGLGYLCKSCQSLRSREYNAAHSDQNAARKRAYREDNRDRVLASDKAYRTEHKAARAEYNRKYREVNRDRFAERDRAYRVHYRAEHAEQLQQQSADWRRKNADHVHAYTKNRYRNSDPNKRREQWRAWANSPEGRASRKASKHRYRARRLSAPGRHTTTDLVDIRAAQTDKRGSLNCWWCGKPIKGTPHLDHKIALAAGGSNNPGNLCYSCAPCNQGKQMKSPAEFAGRLL